MDAHVDEIKKSLFSIETIDDIRIRELIVFDPSLNLLRQLVELFNRECERGSEKIKNSWAQGQMSELSRAAHKLRSTSLNLAAKRLSEILKTIEYDALRSPPNKEKVIFLVGLVDQEVLNASRALQTYFVS